MSATPRVLLISGEYPPMEGGVGDYTRVLSEALVDRGAMVQVLTSHHAAAGRDGSDGAVRVHATMRDWRWGSLYSAVGDLLRGDPTDVVHIQYQTAAYGMHPAINLLPRRFRHTPFVVTFHDLRVPYLFPKAGPVRRWANLALAQGCRATIVTNEEDRLMLADRQGISHLEVIPIGSNISCAPPEEMDRTVWRARYGVGEDGLLLCYFGFLNDSKGGEELIAALDILCRRGRDAYLLMIGGNVGASDPTNRAYLSRVQESIRDLGLERRVIWTGFLTSREISAAFLSADICVLPYRDGASFRRGSLMAAIEHGMPVVSTHPQVHLDELVHGENIWLVPPCDAGALADGVIRLADDGALRERLGVGARDLARLFDWDEIAARTIDLYTRVLPR
ncbi:MAG: glycosyltransferase family 4 protein [Anaerolineae bacterium]|jgi:glycosyltransferase involved in cell wall biosynthesis